jgi:hypothetical protein
MLLGSLSQQRVEGSCMVQQLPFRKNPSFTPRAKLDAQHAQQQQLVQTHSSQLNYVQQGMQAADGKI